MTALLVTAGTLAAGTLAWLASVPSAEADLRAHAEASRPVSAAQLAPGEDLVMLEQGRAYYVQLCAACHGPRGDGQGEWAYRVTPRPANLLGGRTRARSDAELDRIIRDGLPGSPMIGNRLSGAQRRQLVAYVRHLAGQP